MRLRLEPWSCSRGFLLLEFFSRCPGAIVKFSGVTTTNFREMIPPPVRTVSVNFVSCCTIAPPASLTGAGAADAASGAPISHETSLVEGR